MFRYATSLPPSTFITEQWPASAAGHSSADQSRTKPPTHILAAEARIVKSIWELGKIVNFAGKVPQHYICKVNPKRIWCMARKVISEVYASFVLSLGGNVNTRRMSKPDMGSIFYIFNQWNIQVIGNYYVNYQNYQNLMLLTSSDTIRTLMHLFLFTNSAQRKLVSLCTQSIHDRNKLSLPYILDKIQMWNIFWFQPVYNNG